MNPAYMILNGKKVRVEANWNALITFLSSIGADSMQGLSDLAQLRPSDLAGLMAVCVNEGERLEGRVGGYTGEFIGELCGMQEMGQFISIYVSQTSPKLPAEKKKE